MSPLAAAVLEFFAGHDWPLAEVEPGELYETSFEGEHGAWPCHVHVYPEDGRVVFVSTHTTLVEPEQRPAIAELCNRANFGLAVGNFELDHDGGEVRFRTSLDALDADATRELVRNIVVANVVTFDQYLPAIDAVLAGEAPTNAIEDVEED
jgi:hypothetical protein